jgi:hypothetical protein
MDKKCYCEYFFFVIARSVSDEVISSLIVREKGEDSEKENKKRSEVKKLKRKK